MMTLGLNLFEDSACISTPLSALILTDLENSFFSSLQATESLQLYTILCLARSLSKRRNSSWLGSLTYSIYSKIKSGVSVLIKTVIKFQNVIGYHHTRDFLKSQIRNHPILLITRMFSDRIGRHLVLLLFKKGTF